MKRVAFFSSGNLNSLDVAISSQIINPVLLVSNNDLKELAKLRNVSFLKYTDDASLILELEYQEIDFIILGGYNLLVSRNIFAKYPTYNIHHSLLPKFSGKGMYGYKVHEEVIKNNEQKSGFTIHRVVGGYDEGPIIFQKEIPVLNDNKFTLFNKICLLEKKYLPEFFKKYLMFEELKI